MGQVADAMQIAALAREMGAADCLFRAFQKSENAPTDLIAALGMRPHSTHLDHEELVAIVRVKLRGVAGLNRAEALVRSNSNQLVREATGAALVAIDAEVAVRELRRLKGIGVAVASAVLAWCKPDTWPVIDRRAWATLAAFELVHAKRKGATSFTTSEYATYVGIVRALEVATRRSPQAIDRWLYAFNRCDFEPGDCLPQHAVAAE